MWCVAIKHNGAVIAIRGYFWLRRKAEEFADKMVSNHGSEWTYEIVPYGHIPEVWHD